MALEFKNQLEAIDFGGLVVEPKLDVETRLRLQTIKLTDATAVKEAIEIISGCFGDKKEAVAEFIDENLGLNDIARLQVYLVGGQSMLDKVDVVMNEKLEGALNGE